MDFSLTDEQRQIKDMVDRFVADRYGFEERKRHITEPDGFSRANWAQFREMGLLMLPFSEEDGGIGGGPIEEMLVMEAFGRGLVVEPFLTSVILCGAVLRMGASPAQREALVPALMEGTAIAALAYGEPRSRFDYTHVETTARRDGNGWVLDGQKAVVLGGAAATNLLVTARSAGAIDASEGISLFLVPADADGMTVRGYPTQDSHRAAEVGLAGVRVGADALVGPEGGAAPLVEAALQRATAAICHEAVGAMAALNALTLDYLKTRQQFGVAIGSFQALQHRMVDMKIAEEEARSMALLATIRLGDPDPAVRGRTIAAAKAHIAKAGRLVGQEAIQLHGGIGMTREYAAGHYFMRLTMIDTTFGDADWQLDRFSGLG